MPIRKGSPKKWTSKKKTWSRNPRSTAYRKTSKRVMTASGAKPSIGSAPFKHKFIRSGGVTDLVSYNNGGGFDIAITANPAVTSTGIIFGAPTADTSGVANSYMVGAACSWRITDIYNYTEFTQLFDHYKIDQVDIEISQVQNAASAGNPASQMATVFYAPDYDDDTVPTSAQELLERSRMKKWTFRGDGKPLRISMQPRLSTPIYKNGITSAYGLGPSNLWVDNADLNVPYYGLKFWFENMYGSTALLRGETHFKYTVKYHFSFKEPV